MAALDQDALRAELKKKRICRFCLSRDPSKIRNMYTRDTRIQSSAPLPIQIMAIASIEVFSNDGMPSFVCSDCTNMFEYSYQFKQMCKNADNLLRQFPLTGSLPDSLVKPILHTNQSTCPMEMGLSKTAEDRMTNNTKISVPQELILPNKMFNSSASSKTEAPTAVITSDSLPQFKTETKVEKTDEDCSITFLVKIENNEDLSLDDIHPLVAAEDVNKTDNLPVVIKNSENKNTATKVLSKSSLRIINNAEVKNEPCSNFPKISEDVDRKLDIVAEILDADDKYEAKSDPKNDTPNETNVFPCPYCERTFPLLQLRDIHMKNHSRDRKFQCDSCEKSFFYKYDLTRHSLIHNGEKPFKCSVCKKGFSRSSLLTRHERIHTDVPKHICIRCERSFLSKNDMEKHLERHNINRPFMCKTCNKGFAFKQGLERHEVLHSRQQPFPCQYCESSFSTSTKLSRHLTAHAGLRPHPCKFCKKSYLLSHHLTRHLRSHKNIDDPINSISFMCMICKTSFESRDELISHSTTHANENNLACPLCKDVLGNMLELTAHIQDHSEGETYACEFCDLIFMTAQKLQTHTDIDHLQEMEVYHADDRDQADKRREAATKQTVNTYISVDKLQNTRNEFLDEFPNEEVELEISSTENDNKETDQPSNISSQITQNASNDKNGKNQTDDPNSLLISLKQRRIDEVGKNVKTVLKTPQRKRSTKSPKRSGRKIVDVKGTPNIEDSKQSLTPSSSLKYSDTETRSLKLFSSKPSYKPPPLKKMIVAKSVPTPKIIKIENESSLSDDDKDLQKQNSTN